MSDDIELRMFTVYRSAPDGAAFAVIEHSIRPNNVKQERGIAFVNSLDLARSFVQLRLPGAYRLERDEHDAPNIVEIWL